MTSWAIDAITSQDFTSALLQSFLSVKGNSAPESLTTQLIRELGLLQSQPYDLFSDSAADVRFNSLQYALLLIDFYAAAKQAEAAIPVTPPPDAGNAVAPGTQAAGVPKLSLHLNAEDAATDGSYMPCVAVRETGVTILRGGLLSAGLGQLLKAILLRTYTQEQVTMLLGRAGAWATIIQLNIQALHAIIMSSAVQISAPDGFPFHYRHSTEPDPITVPVHIEMTRELPDWVVKCGALSGLKWPRKGGIPGIKVVFDTSQLSLHTDSIEGCTDNCVKTTDESGTASLTFAPKIEALPGQGRIVSEPGNIGLNALVLSGLGNEIGFVNSFFGFKIGYTASYHTTGLHGTITITMRATLPETLVRQSSAFTQQTSAIYVLTYVIQPTSLASSGDGYQLWATKSVVSYKLEESWNDHGEVALACGGANGTAISDFSRDVSGSGTLHADFVLLVTPQGVQVYGGNNDYLPGTVKEAAFSSILDPCGSDTGSSITSIGPYPIAVDIDQPLGSIAGQVFPLSTTTPLVFESEPWQGIYLGTDSSTITLDSHLQPTNNN